MGIECKEKTKWENFFFFLSVLEYETWEWKRKLGVDKMFSVDNANVIVYLINIEHL